MDSADEQTAGNLTYNYWLKKIENNDLLALLSLDLNLICTSESHSHKDNIFVPITYD